jgi:hypothetical protein
VFPPLVSNQVRLIAAVVDELWLNLKSCYFDCQVLFSLTIVFFHVLWIEINF